MCVMSMVMDHYQEKWEPRLYQTTLTVGSTWPAITPEEVAEFRTLLERAREYDRSTGQPDCELDTKRQAVKSIAKQLGVEIAFL